MKLKKIALAFVYDLFAGVIYSQQTEDEQALEESDPKRAANRPQNQTQTSSTGTRSITTTTVTTTIVVTNYVPRILRRSKTSRSNRSSSPRIPGWSRSRSIPAGPSASGPRRSRGIPRYLHTRIRPIPLHTGRLEGRSYRAHSFRSRSAHLLRSRDSHRDPRHRQPNVYGALHYASLGLFLGSYLLRHHRSSHLLKKL
jgi:hypothetical protein